MAAIDTPFPLARPRYTGILEWATTVDHKKIGVLYLWTTFLFFFLVGGDPRGSRGHCGSRARPSA